MRRKLRVWAVFCVLCLCILALGATRSEALPLIFDLNSVIGGNGPVPSAVSFGTVSLSDNGNNVDVLIDLAGSGEKVLRMYLNFNDTLFSNSSKFNTTNYFGVIVQENGNKPDGYGGYFDLKIPDPPPGNLGYDPVRFTLTLKNYNLDPSHFNYRDTHDKLFAAVHIGNYGSTPGSAGNNSIWVGAAVPPIEPLSSSVPEPSTWLLLGFGLLGLALFSRLTKKTV